MKNILAHDHIPTYSITMCRETPDPMASDGSAAARLISEPTQCKLKHIVLWTVIKRKCMCMLD